MWLSGQQKQPADTGEGQTGIVTMSGGELAVQMDCERRGLQIYSPGGYTWTPKVGHRVLVIRGQGEIPCVVGEKQGQDRPDHAAISARQAEVKGEQVNITGSGGVGLNGPTINLTGAVYVNGEKLEAMIARIVRSLL